MARVNSELEGYDEIGYYRPAIERLRIILMFFLCIDLLGFPTMFGGIISTFCGFVPIAFFIISGYLVLRDDADRSKRIVRTIKRTAIVFAILLIVYFGLNFLYYRLLGVNIFDAFKQKSLYMTFAVFNVWPFDIGGAIWYVQSLLYAYIIIYFLDKLKLLKFDWIISLVLIAFTIVTGELCGLLKINIAGYSFLPGNFFTRALPYLLLGCFIHRKMYVFNKLNKLEYCGGIVIGTFLMFAELVLLSIYNVPGYYGHLFGMPIVAVSACMLAFGDMEQKDGFEASLNLTRRSTNFIYYMCQPVSVIIAFVLSFMLRNYFVEFSGYIGIVTFLICFGIIVLVCNFTRMMRAIGSYFRYLSHFIFSND